MALTGDVEQFDGFELLFLEASKRGLGVGQVEILLSGHQHVAAILLRHGKNLGVRQVAGWIDFLLRIEGRRVEVRAHEAERAGEHVRVGHAEHGGHARTAAEAGNVNAIAIHIEQVAQVVIRVDGQSHAIRHGTLITALAGTDGDEFFVIQHLLPVQLQRQLLARHQPQNQQGHPRQLLLIT